VFGNVSVPAVVPNAVISPVAVDPDTAEDIVPTPDEVMLPSNVRLLDVSTVSV
jgi:hypothetical protein